MGYASFFEDVLARLERDLSDMHAGTTPEPLIPWEAPRRKRRATNRPEMQARASALAALGEMRRLLKAVDAPAVELAHQVSVLKRSVDELKLRLEETTGRLVATERSLKREHQEIERLKAESLLKSEHIRRLKELLTDPQLEAARVGQSRRRDSPKRRSRAA